MWGVWETIFKIMSSSQFHVYIYFWKFPFYLLLFNRFSPAKTWLCQWLVCSAFKSLLGYRYVLFLNFFHIIFFLFLFLVLIEHYSLIYDLFSHFSSLRLQQSIFCYVSVGLLLPIKHTGYITFDSLNLIKYVLCFYVVASRNTSISESK